ncbi:MAG: DDE-type integrase/transposase/recombinase [Faecalicoccus sp.]|nr:DDE-type integrase/transposase/recombinase [Faecalicoccus sp.]
MDSITQLLDLVKILQTNIFTFSTQLEPLLLAKEIPDNLARRINSLEFIQLVDDCSKAVERLSDFINVLNPELAKQIKSLLKKPRKSKDHMIPYADFTVDEPPLFDWDVKVSTPSFSELYRQAELNNHPITPVRRRTPFSFEGTCPFCGAPKQYIYDNSKGKGQFQCKACHNTFTTKTTSSDEIGIYCPHCGRKLTVQHDRKGYVVYSCQNNKCPYYKKNKKLFKEGKAEHLKTSSGRDRFRYHYREFKFDMETLKRTSESVGFDINKIHFDQKVLALVLTYYVNFGLSSRKTALILRQVHGLNISHQTIMNYASKISRLIKPLVDNYPYQLGNTMVGDETYVHVKGKNNYVFFWSDPERKIITSYQINATRNTQDACQSIYDVLSKYKEIPEDLLLITDGNPIYNAAQLFFHLNQIDFTLKQVIGVKNQDDTSKEYRPYKQIEERLNRTYKQNYYGTNGYSTLEAANEYMVLYVTFFNFLRQHSALKYKTPVDDGLFEENSLMPDRWLKLIELSSQYHQSN